MLGAVLRDQAIESRMSRSVKMPMPACSASITTAAPIRRLDIIRAAWRSVCAGPMVRTRCDMPSRTCTRYRTPWFRRL